MRHHLQGQGQNSLQVQQQGWTNRKCNERAEVAVWLHDRRCRRRHIPDNRGGEKGIDKAADLQSDARQEDEGRIRERVQGDAPELDPPPHHQRFGAESNEDAEVAE